MHDTPELRLQALRAALDFHGPSPEHNDDADDVAATAQTFLTFLSAAPAYNN